MTSLQQNNSCIFGQKCCSFLFVPRIQRHLVEKEKIVVIVLLSIVGLTYFGCLLTLVLLRNVWWQLLVSLVLALAFFVALTAHVLALSGFLIKYKEGAEASHQEERRLKVYVAIWTLKFWTPAAVQFLCVIGAIACITMLAGTVTHYSVTKKTGLPFGCARNEVVFYDFDSLSVIWCDQYFLYAHIFGVLLLICAVASIALIIVRYILDSPSANLATKIPSADVLHSSPPPAPTFAAPKLVSSRQQTMELASVPSFSATAYHQNIPTNTHQPE